MEKTMKKWEEKQQLTLSSKADGWKQKGERIML
jgi:hypothetical protein